MDDSEARAGNDVPELVSSRTDLSRASPIEPSWIATTWSRRAALSLIAALAALVYGWALNADPLETYYGAAVRSMSMSWHDFLFGAFDPSGTVTLDKLPGAFWIQALSVRAFGFHTWAVVLPQALEGVLTVVVLYLTVTRLAGALAGLVAALVLAVSPASAALDRGNISDTLMILFLVLAAEALTRAILRGRQGPLVVAAFWIGLAFQAKMIEAWMVIPAFALSYLLDGRESTRRHVRQLVIAGAVAAVASLSWMTAVTFVPAHDRPYIDGSHDNSAYAQVFVYNGFGRFSDETPLQLLAGQSFAGGLLFNSKPPGPGRLLGGALGRDTGWLLPTALLLAGMGILVRRRQARGDPLRAAFVLWGAWLATLSVVFSATTAINPYYTGALSPAIAAIMGTAVALAWRSDRRSTAVRVLTAAFIAGTGAYAGSLVASAGAGAPSWVLVLTVAVAVIAVGVSVASIVLTRETIFPWVIGAGIAASLVAPTAASSLLASNHEGAFDTPFESARAQLAVKELFVTVPAQVAHTLAKLQQAQLGAPDLLATQTSALAAVFIYDFGHEVLPIGGFTGTIPSPTLAELEADVRRGEFHLVITGSSSDPRIKWIASHCQRLANSNPLLHNYFCGSFG